MNVYGVEITEAQVSSCMAVMQGSFTAGEVEKAAIAAGVPALAVPPGGYTAALVAMRLVDRLLQKQKRQGRIAFKAGRWAVLDAVQV